MKKILIKISVLILSTILLATSAMALNCPSGYYFDHETISVYLYPYISNNYGSSVYSALWVGCSSWTISDENTGANVINIVVNNTNENSDILAHMDNYGNTSWDGLADYDKDETPVIEEGGMVAVNVYRFKDDTGAFSSSNYCNLWKAIICHEVGHVLGLKHSQNGSDSIMVENTDDYYDVYNSSPKTKSPTADDIAAMTYVYTTRDLE